MHKEYGNDESYRMVRKVLRSSLTHMELLDNI